MASFFKFFNVDSWVWALLMLLFPLFEIINAADVIILSHAALLFGLLVWAWLNYFQNDLASRVPGFTMLFLFWFSASVVAISWLMSVSQMTYPFVFILLSIPFLVQLILHRYVKNWVFLSLIAVAFLASALLGDVDYDVLLVSGLAWVMAGLLAAWLHNARYQQVVIEHRYDDVVKNLENIRKQLSAHENERYATEHQLSIARDFAEAASVAKTEFLATMSHEIRTPMNGILPILELLRDTSLSPEQTGFVDTALDSSRHLLRIINDILDYSRAEVGKLELEQVNLNVREIIESVVGLMSGSAERKGLKINAIVHEDVPLLVRGDPIRLRQILSNLVGNAIKFTKKGGVSLEVILQKNAEDVVDLVFVIRDTGIGMTKESMEHLFMPFSQADASTTRMHGGSGLGLAICRRFVELMDGNIGVKTQLGVGSLFWFQIPFRASPVESSAVKTTLSGVRALVVSANSDMRGWLSGYLQTWGLMQSNMDSAIEAMSNLSYEVHTDKNRQCELLIVDANGLDAPIADFLANVSKTQSLQNMKVLVLGLVDPERTDLLDNEDLVFLGDVYKDTDIRRALLSLFNVRELDQNILWRESSKDSVGIADVAAQQKILASDISQHHLEGDVLLVEDNPVNLTVAKKLIENIGLCVDEATDGQVALERMASTTYDLVIMDCQMPGMDGYEAARRMRQRELEKGIARVPVIAMTANVMPGDREKCYAAGMDDYISKPLDQGELLRILRKWMPLQITVDLMPNSSGFSDTSGLGTVSPESDLTDSDLAEFLEPMIQVAPEHDITLNVAAIEELKSLIGSGFTHLIHSYLSSARDLLRACVEGQKESDYERISKAAHSLKSSSANIGGIKQSYLAKLLEASAAESNSLAVKQTVESLVIEAEHLKRKLIPYM